MVKLEKISFPGEFPIIYQTGTEYARTCWAATIVEEEDGTCRMCTNTSMRECRNRQEMRMYAQCWGWTF